MGRLRVSLASVWALLGLLAEPATAELIYGNFPNTNSVVSFDTANTGTLISSYPFSGPPPTNFANLIDDIAVRSDTGQLYGVSGVGIYLIDPNTGMKTLVAPSPVTSPDFMSLGSSFQPGTGNLFVTSYPSGTLLEINVDTGVATTLGPLVFAPTDVHAGQTTYIEALTWGTPPGGTAPVLYGIDATVGLVAINPSSGQKTTVGPIPALVGSASGAGFTFSYLTGTAYADFTKANSNGVFGQFLYTVDLQSGGTALVGLVDHFPSGALQIAAANAEAVPEPGTLVLAGFAMAALVILRRVRA